MCAWTASRRCRATALPIRRRRMQGSVRLHPPASSRMPSSSSRRRDRRRTDSRASWAESIRGPLRRVSPSGGSAPKRVRDGGNDPIDHRLRLLVGEGAIDLAELDRIGEGADAVGQRGAREDVEQHACRSGAAPRPRGSRPRRSPPARSRGRTNARSRRTGGNRGMSSSSPRAATPPRSGSRPTTHTATRPSISNASATRGWISPSTPACRSPIEMAADRPGWKGRRAARPGTIRPPPGPRAPRRGSLLHPRRRRRDVPRTTPPRPARSGRTRPSPCSVNGSASAKGRADLEQRHLSRRHARGCARPRAAVPGSAACAGTRLPREAGSRPARRRCRRTDRGRPAEANGSGRISRRPARTSASLDPSGERVRRRDARRPAGREAGSCRPGRSPGSAATSSIRSTSRSMSTR